MGLISNWKKRQYLKALEKTKAALLLAGHSNKKLCIDAIDKLREHIIIEDEQGELTRERLWDMTHEELIQLLEECLEEIKRMVGEPE